MAARKTPDEWDAVEHIENLKDMSKTTKDDEHSAIALAVVWIIRRLDLRPAPPSPTPMLRFGKISVYSFSGLISLLIILLFLDKLGLIIFAG